MTSDGNSDLVIGAPFAGSGGEQRGFVAALYADVKYDGMSNRMCSVLENNRSVSNTNSVYVLYVYIILYR